jgi:hypothetical protein
MSRLHESQSNELKKRMQSWGNSPLKEMGYALSTKLDMLSVVADRVNSRLRELRDQFIEDYENVNECVENKHAYNIQKEQFPYALLVDIESFIFESRSLYEILGRFLREFFSRILGLKVDEKQLSIMLQTQGIDTRWISILRDSRILFFHKTAPWLIIEFQSLNPPEFDLLILKRDVKDPLNSDAYYHFKELRDIFEGFKMSMEGINKWVLEQIENYEQKHNKALAADNLNAAAEEHR